MSDFVHRVVDSMIAGAAVPVSLRACLLRRTGYRVGERLEMYSGAQMRSKRIAFGDSCFVNAGLFYDGCGDVTVGNRVAFGPHVRLITATHDIGPSEKRCSSHAVVRPIIIEDGCWLAAGVTVLPGVTVQRGCVVGAGAVVTASTEPDGLYLGVPARRVRDLASARDLGPGRSAP